MRVLAVIPAFNEADSLPGFLRELRERRPELDLLVVDDGSSDGTAATVAAMGVRRIQLPENLGLGSAVRCGLRYALESGFDAAVRLDADGQHPSEAVGELLSALSSADAALGSRHLVPGSYRSSPIRRLGQWGLAGLMTAVGGQRVTDPTSGFWAFGPRALKLLAVHHPTGYPEPELRLLLRKRGLRVVEVPVAMRERRQGKSSLTFPRVAHALARVLLAMVLVPLREGAGQGD